MLKFSIITVVFNGEKVIDRTMLSVLEQSFDDYEQLIIDGGSKDKTLDIVQGFNNPHVKVISEKDEGIYDAMNKGLDLAAGEYVIFMNSGDSFADRDVLKRVANELDGKHHFYGDSIRSHNGIRTQKREKSNSFSITRHNICHQSIFYLRKPSVHYNLNYRIFADWELNIREYKSCGFIYLPIPICEFTMDGVSSNSDRFKDRKFMEDLPNMVRSYIGLWQYLFVRIRFELRRYV